MYVFAASVAIGLVVAVGVVLGTFALLRPYWALERIRPATPGAATGPTSWALTLGKVESVLKSVGETIPRAPEELSRQGLRLVQAGIRRKDGPLLFLGIQVGMAVLLLAGFSVFGFPRGSVILGVLVAVLGGAALPDIALKMRIRNRHERIQMALPDALDLTVVCVEAGLGLNQALMRIGNELRTTHPDLSDELNVFNLEMSAGRGRIDAMRNLAKRVDLDDLKALVAILIQAERFGTSIGQSLRVFSEGMRTKRRQRAEERAAKTAIKMIPPMVLFVFPSMFVVVVGPAAISIVRQLLPFLAGN
jgi:tight adherence protein C